MKIEYLRRIPESMHTREMKKDISQKVRGRIVNILTIIKWNPNSLANSQDEHSCKLHKACFKPEQAYEYYHRRMFIAEVSMFRIKNWKHVNRYNLQNK